MLRRRRRTTSGPGVDAQGTIGQLSLARRSEGGAGHGRDDLGAVEARLREREAAVERLQETIRANDAEAAARLNELAGEIAAAEERKRALDVELADPRNDMDDDMYLF